LEDFGHGKKVRNLLYRHTALIFGVRLEPFLHSGKALVEPLGVLDGNFCLFRIYPWITSGKTKDSLDILTEGRLILFVSLASGHGDVDVVESLGRFLSELCFCTRLAKLKLGHGLGDLVKNAGTKGNVRP